jgi:signal transduction histidine kinase
MESDIKYIMWLRRWATPLNSASTPEHLETALKHVVAGLSELPEFSNCAIAISINTGENGIRADVSSGGAKLCFEWPNATQCACLSTVKERTITFFDSLPNGLCRDSGFVSGLCVPIISGEDKLGLFLVLSRQPLEKNHKSIALLETMLEHVGLATDRVKAIVFDRQRAKDMHTVNTIGGLITSKLNLKDMVKEIVSTLGTVLETDEVNVITYDNNRRELSFLASYFSDGSDLDRPEVYQLSNGINSWIIKNKKPLLMTDDTEKECVRLGIRHGGRPAKSWLGAPMIFKDQVVGVVSVQSYSKKQLYGEDSVLLLKAVANQCAVAVENARLFEQITEREAEKEQLYFSLTHDLLSLISPVDGFAKILSAMADDTAKKDINYIAGNIIKATEKITRFTEDILVYAKIKSGKLSLDISRCDIYTPLVSALSVYLPEFAMRKTKVEINGKTVNKEKCQYGDPIPVDLDVTQIERVFINLIGNAIKHAHSTIKITVLSSDTEIGVIFKDDGDGVEAKLCPKLFDEYYQVKSRIKGVGLGLPSVKKIIELHNGHVNIQSDIGHGFEVKLRWPKTLADKAKVNGMFASAL